MTWLFLLTSFVWLVPDPVKLAAATLFFGRNAGAAADRWGMKQGWCGFLPKRIQPVLNTEYEKRWGAVVGSSSDSR